MDESGSESEDPLAWERLRTQTVYECPGFDVIHDAVRLPDGTETTYDFVSEPPAVVILPFTQSGDVVVIEEWRQAVDRTNRGIPAGTIEADERPAEAARRELGEETGYAADAIEHLLTVEPSNGISDSVHHHFLARGCERTSAPTPDTDESIRVETCAIDELRTAIEADRLRDGRAALAVLAYDLRYDPRK